MPEENASISQSSSQSWLHACGVAGPGLGIQQRRLHLLGREGTSQSSWNKMDLWGDFTKLVGLWRPQAQPAPSTEGEKHGGPSLL